MTSECADCGGSTTRFRPATSVTGLPVGVRVPDGVASLSGFVCADCGRVQFTAALDAEAADGDPCSVCAEPAAEYRLGTAGEDLRLKDIDAGTRYSVRAVACGDCGAVEVSAEGVGSADGTDCPACEGRMGLTEPIVGASSVRLVDDDAGASLEPRSRVEPVAWACEDCGLALVYDRAGGS